MKDTDNTLEMRILTMGLAHTDHSFFCLKGIPLELKKTAEQVAFFVQGPKYKATRPFHGY